MIIYLNGGNTYIGEKEDITIKELIEYGKKYGQKYLYLGYRYYNNKKDKVAVFDKRKWSKKEIVRRNKNGFLGIKEYSLKKLEKEVEKWKKKKVLSS